MAGPYKTRIEHLAKNRSGNMDSLVRLMCRQEQKSTSVFYIQRSKNGPVVFRPRSANDLIKQAEFDSRQDITAMCIIENISPAFIEQIGTSWSIDPQFFANHASNPDEDRLWDRNEWTPQSKLATSQHLHGIFEYHGMDVSIDHMKVSQTNYCDRHFFRKEPWPANSNTVISYLRVLPTFYLFLVDPIIKYEQALIKPCGSQARIMLRFPYAINRGGLLIPPLRNSKIFVPLESLEKVFQHTWLVDLLFCKSEPFPSVPLLYMLSSSLWETNLSTIDEEIKNISFYQIRRPNLGVTDPLHELRRELWTLRMSVMETKRYRPASVVEFFDGLRKDVPNLNMRRTPIEIHDSLLEQANQVHALVLETFQLLMNTIAVQDSQFSIRQTNQSLKQTRQSILLTGLAAIYLPLSLATGIFGMNLNEMTGSGPRAWVFGVTVVLLVSLTLLGFLLKASSTQLQRLLQPHSRDPSKLPKV